MGQIRKDTSQSHNVEQKKPDSEEYTLCYPIYEVQEQEKLICGKRYQDNRD